MRPPEITPSGFRRVKLASDGGVIYKPADGKADAAFTITPQDEADEKRRHRIAIEQARECWAEAGRSGVNHRRVREYLAFRGILIEGRIPLALRFHADCPNWSDKTTCPAMVAGVFDHSGSIVAVHCTYLATDRPGKRAEDAKKMRGSVKGQAVRLAPDTPGGVLILAEGIETALSCQVATGWTAWACLSASGIQNLELPATGLRRIIIAADNNRVGRNAAAILTNRYPDRRVETIAPDVCTDWNDVLIEHRPDAIRHAFKAPPRMKEVV